MYDIIIIRLSYNNYKIISSVVMLLGECKDKEMVNKCMESKEGIIDAYHGNNIWIPM